MPKIPRAPRVFAPAIVAALFVAACSTPGASPSGSPLASASASPSGSASAPASPSASASPSVSTGTGAAVGVTAKDYSFELPATIEGGAVTVALSNVGQEPHQAQIAKVADGKTMNDLIAALQQPDPTAAFALLTFAGGPTGVQPGETRTTTQQLDVGTYAFLCFVESPDGLPHLAKGMVAGLQVTTPSAQGVLPDAAAEVTAKDFTFSEGTTIGTGPQVVSLVNEGPQPHEATVVKLADGVTVDAIRAQLSASPAASAASPSAPAALPWSDVGGIAAVQPGDSATFELDLPAGDYAFVCYVPDPASGKAHLELGMIAPLTIG